MSEQIGRRDLLKIASATLVGLAGGRLATGMPHALVQNVGKAANWSPAFFNAHQNETVVALTDLIIPKTDTPGAKEAGVNRYLDLFMTVKSPAEQKQFVDGLASLDAGSKQLYQKQFVDCTPAEQAKVLGGMTQEPFFAQAKGLTSSIYYNTAEGYAELNKSGGPPASLACEKN